MALSTEGSLEIQIERYRDTAHGVGDTGRDENRHPSSTSRGTPHRAPDLY